MSNNTSATSDLCVWKLSRIHNSSHCTSLIVSSKGFVGLDWSTNKLVDGKGHILIKAECSHFKTMAAARTRKIRVSFTLTSQEFSKLPLSFLYILFLKCPQPSFLWWLWRLPWERWQNWAGAWELIPQGPSAGSRKHLPAGSYISAPWPTCGTLLFPSVTSNKNTTSRRGPVSAPSQKDQTLASSLADVSHKVQVVSEGNNHASPFPKLPLSSYTLNIKPAWNPSPQVVGPRGFVLTLPL